MSLPPLPAALARLLTLLGAGTMALLLVLLIWDPFRVETVARSPKRPLHLWLDASLSMRPFAPRVQAFLDACQKLRHLETEVHLLTPELAPSGPGPMENVMVGQSSGGWAAARAIRRSGVDSVHGLLSDFRWPPGDPILSDFPQLTRVLFSDGENHPGVHLDHPLFHIPLLAGEPTSVSIKVCAPNGGTLTLRHGMVGQGHPERMNLAQRSETILADDLPAEAAPLTFTPPREGFYYISARLESQGRVVSRDHLVFQVAASGLSLEAIFGQADYGARDLADLLSRYGALRVSRHVFLKPGTEAEWEERLATEKVDPQALWILFAPTPELVAVALRKARGVLWFPLTRPQGALSVWKGGQVLSGGPTVFRTGPFLAPGESPLPVPGIATRVAYPTSFFDEAWEGQGDHCALGRRGGVIFAGFSPMPALGSEAMARGLRAMVLTLHSHTGPKSGRLQRLATLEPLTNMDPKQFRLIELPSGPVALASLAAEKNLGTLMKEGGLLWGDGPGSGPQLALWRLPLSEDPAFTPSLGLGLSADEAFRQIEKENRPSPPRSYRERRALAGPWVAIPFTLALFLFVWARYAPRKKRGEA